VHPRVLPLLNAIGCLLLAALIVAQWQRERALNASTDHLASELAATRATALAESRRAAALERDIAVLKEAITATQSAAEESARARAESHTHATHHAAEAEAARTQLASWQTAVAERDAKLLELNAQLSATRQRLTEALDKLRAAGAR